MWSPSRVQVGSSGPNCWSGGRDRGYRWAFGDTQVQPDSLPVPKALKQGWGDRGANQNKSSNATQSRNVGNSKCGQRRCAADKGEQEGLLGKPRGSAHIRPLLLDTRDGGLTANPMLATPIHSALHPLVSKGGPDSRAGEAAPPQCLTWAISTDNRSTPSSAPPQLPPSLEDKSLHWPSLHWPPRGPPSRSPPATSVTRLANM